MKNLKKQRRIQIIVLTTVALIISTALIGYAMRDGINFFRAPSQIIAEPPPPTEVFRIGGLVEEGSIVRGQGETIRFSVTDGGAVIPVTYTGVLPDLFEE
ncbi:MAG: cytochrome c maturation protein CcmE, partial [Pseudomonadota bacterium]